MSTPSQEPGPPVRAIDRFLAFGALGLAAASVLCFLAIILGSAAGMAQADFSSPLWQVIAAVPLVGLPLGFVMMVTLLVMSFVRKGRAGKRP